MPSQPPDSPLPPLPEPVGELLTKQGWGPVCAAEALSGGMHSQTLRIHTERGPSLVLKRHTKPTPPDGVYHREAQGLRFLAQPGAPRVPEVFAVGDEYLLMEDLGPPMAEPGDREWERFGQAVAMLHRCTNDRFGCDYGPHRGLVKQGDVWMDDGVEHWLATRLLHFLSWPHVEQTLSAEDRRDVERFADVFRRVVPHDRPAIIHGDLWRTNAFVLQSGEPALIDPDAVYGLREHDVAIAMQGGGIPGRFYEAYHEAFPLAPGWRERLPIYFPCIPLGMIAYVGGTPEYVQELRDNMRAFL
jgi:fructosamine-3-kinase